MRFLVTIDPGDLLTGLHGDGLRIKGEVFDFDFGSLALTLPVFAISPADAKRATELTAHKIAAIWILGMSVFMGLSC